MADGNTPKTRFWRRKSAAAPARMEPSFEAMRQAEADPMAQAAVKAASTAGDVLTPAESFAAGAAAPSIIRILFKWFERYERQLSGAGMVGGFAFDNYNFRRIDLPNTQFVFIGYLTLAAISILILHGMTERAARGHTMPRWHAILPMAAQFALGALWSAFLVFYSRGAVLTASWPFMLVLVAIFIANEVFKKYHSRLVFTAVLFFFALFSYAIVTTPILTGSIGTLTFLISGLVSLILFSFFLKLVKAAGKQQWRGAKWWIALGTVVVYATLNAFYFADVLPPLPLALADGGIYRFVAKKGNEYDAVGEPQPWTTLFGVKPVMHVTAGQPLYVYTAVFAPIKISTAIVHRWQHYNTTRRKWQTVERISYAINGGRDGGYRSYTINRHIVPGDWRVDVSTGDGHTIGRIRFAVETAVGPLVSENRILK
ncbi:MAG TPA: DUF2914 domain-containing protein [Rhizomicrobium sp.]|jgi:hypothetical protein